MSPMRACRLKEWQNQTRLRFVLQRPSPAPLRTTNEEQQSVKAFSTRQLKTRNWHTSRPCKHPLVDKISIYVSYCLTAAERCRMCLSGALTRCTRSNRTVRKRVTIRTTLKSKPTGQLLTQGASKASITEVFELHSQDSRVLGILRLLSWQSKCFSGVPMASDSEPKRWLDDRTSQGRITVCK